MKKILSVLLIVATMLCYVTSVSAVADESNSGADYGTVTFNIADLATEAVLNGAVVNATTRKISLDIPVSNTVTAVTDVYISTPLLRSSGTKNVTVSGRFVKTSDLTTVVSIYGLSGSFSYTNTDTSVTGESSYHYGALGSWSGTHQRSSSKDDANKTTLKCDYISYNEQGNQAGTAQVKISIVKNTGVISVTGDYTGYTIV
jgi:hypothetical protein